MSHISENHSYFCIIIRHNQNIDTMRKTILILVTLLLTGSTAFAGGDFDFGIGPKVGYQATKLSYYKADIKSGFSNHFTAGISSRFTIGRFYVQPELFYLKTSDVFNVTATGEESNNLFNLPANAEVKLTLTNMNLQLPVLLGLKFVDNKIISLRAQVGPTINFILKSETQFDKTNTLNNNPYEVTNERINTKTVTWGLQAGLGIDLLRRITLDINYNFGLSKVIKSLDNTALGNTFDLDKIDKSHQNTFMVTVGFMFF